MDSHLAMFLAFGIICFIIIMLGFMAYLIKQNKKNNAIIRAVEKERIAIQKAIDEENQRLKEDWEAFYKNKY